MQLGRLVEGGEDPGIYGIDTRALTKKLREHGVMMGRIVIAMPITKLKMEN